MKKNIIYSLSLFLLLSLSACNQWLEVEPKTEIKSDKMFENETGFRDALIGCYMMMAEISFWIIRMKSGHASIVLRNLL